MRQSRPESTSRAGTLGSPAVDPVVGQYGAISKGAHQLRPPPSRRMGRARQSLPDDLSALGITGVRRGGCHGGRHSAPYRRSEPGFSRGFKSGACSQRYLQLWSGAA